MKPVTKERLEKFINTKDRWEDSKKECKIFEALVGQGMSSVMGRPDKNKATLELNILGAFDKADLEKRMRGAGIGEPETLKVRSRLAERLQSLKSDELDCIVGWVALYEHSRDRIRAARDFCLRQQSLHNVSGLHLQTVDFGHSILTFWEHDLRFELTSADREILSAQRWEVVDAFIRAISCNGMQLYSWRDERLLKPSVDEILAACARGESAEVYSELYFTNTKELDAIGFTKPTRTPISPDHKKEWQLTLWVGGETFYGYQGEGYPTVG